MTVLSWEREDASGGLDISKLRTPPFLNLSSRLHLLQETVQQ